MTTYLIAALLWGASLVASGFYWHHIGYEDAQRDAKAHEADAVVAGIEAANELSRADSKRALDAERARQQQRTEAQRRSDGLEHSIRTEVVYRDVDCRIPEPDGLRINAALAAARGADPDAAGRSDGAVPSAGRPAAAGSRSAGVEAARDERSAGRVQREAP